MGKSPARSGRGRKRKRLEQLPKADRNARRTGNGNGPLKAQRTDPGARSRGASLRNGGSVAVAARNRAAHPPETAGRRVAQGRLKYVYCIIQEGKTLSFGPLGLGPEPSEVHLVNYRDLAAVVSDTPMGVHDPTRENVLAHQRVNEVVMRDYTVIPMSFGTVFKTDQDIIELLKSAYEAFKDVLAKMQNKLEFGLKVLWDRDQIVREIEEEEEDIHRLKSEILTQKGSTYFARMQYGRMIDVALQSRSEYYWPRSRPRLR